MHIVSFDVPYPANYGGVMDVFYKLKWLKRQNVSIHLHCFTYGREPASELLAYCETVNYYKRKTGLWSHVSFLPYTVKSRQSRALRENLLKDRYPILFEVLHTTYLMNDPEFAGRNLIYRHSNIEHEYYRGLAKSERNFLKKIYLRFEAFKLRRYESVVSKASLILAVNQSDAFYFQQHYPKVHTVYLPSFHPNEEMGKPSSDSFILFHGNLSVSENSEALAWLLQQVFSRVPYKVVVAGLNPPDFLLKMSARYSQVQLVPSPSDAQMQNLLERAKLHVLYTGQGTGLKLKLLNVLYTGNLVLCNPPMLEGTGIKPNHTIKLASSPEEFCSQITVLMNKTLSSDDLKERARVLESFNNEQNALRLSHLLFS